MASFLLFSVGEPMYILHEFSMHNVANVALSGLKKGLADGKHSSSTWLGFFHPHSLLKAMGVLAAMVGGESTKDLGA